MSPKRIVSLTLVLLVALSRRPAPSRRPPRPRRQARARARRHPRDRRHDRRRPAEGRRARLQVRQPLDRLPHQGRPGHREARPPRGRADRVHRQPGHERRRLGQARQARERAPRAADVDGIVVTHGTDTLEETGFFLGLVLKSDKPVVLVGSMRPATSQSADGPLNLYNAVAVAADPAAQRARRHGRRERRGPHGPRHPQDPHDRRQHVRLGHARHRSARSTTARSATATPDVPPHGRRASSPTAPRSISPPRVDIVYAHEGVDGTMVKAAVAAGAKGIVLAGVGDGNATTDMINALAEAAKSGVVVVRSIARRNRDRPPEHRAERRQARVRRRPWT